MIKLIAKNQMDHAKTHAAYAAVSLDKNSPVLKSLDGGWNPPEKYVTHSFSSFQERQMVNKHLEHHHEQIAVLSSNGLPEKTPDSLFQNAQVFRGIDMINLTNIQTLLGAPAALRRPVAPRDLSGVV